MGAVTYPDASVSNYIAEHFVSLEVSMGVRENWPIFRANHIIWTPSVGFMDRNGAMHHMSPGFLPPGEMLSALRIGRARCLMAWMRSAEAIVELQAAADQGDAMAPEALWWLAAAYFLERRDSTRMYEVWEKLLEVYPDSPWAKRTYARPYG
jgi:hypothetical protein